MIPFSVVATNEFGQGEPSDFNTTGAKKYSRPSKPWPVYTRNDDADVVVEWSQPYNGGSPITGYEVLFSQHQYVMPQTPSEDVPLYNP